MIFIDLLGLLHLSAMHRIAIGSNNMLSIYFTVSPFSRCLLICVNG